MFVLGEHTCKYCCCSQVLPLRQLETGTTTLGLNQHLPSWVQVLLATGTICPQSVLASSQVWVALCGN